MEITRLFLHLSKKINRFLCASGRTCLFVCLLLFFTNQICWLFNRFTIAAIIFFRCNSILRTGLWSLKSLIILDRYFHFFLSFSVSLSHWLFLCFLLAKQLSAPCFLLASVVTTVQSHVIRKCASCWRCRRRFAQMTHNTLKSLLDIREEIPLNGRLHFKLALR